MRRSALSIALSMLAVFLSGALVGAFAHRLYTARVVDAATQRRSPAEFRQKYLNDMQSRLQLDDGQTARLGTILDNTRQRFRAFNEKHKAELSAIQDEQVSEIRSILNADQLARYEEYRQERDRKRREHEKSR
jgi:hypothetical protein